MSYYLTLTLDGNSSIKAKFTSFLTLKAYHHVGKIGQSELRQFYIGLFLDNALTDLITGTGTISEIDMRRLIELGLHIIRFQMSNITERDKIKLLTMLKSAVRYCCEKYEVSTWPIAISIDLPHFCIRTGRLSPVKINLTILIASTEKNKNLNSFCTPENSQ